MNKFLLFNCLAILTLSSCYQTDPESRKKEIIDFCGNTFEYAGGILRDKGLVGSDSMGIVTYSEYEREKGDDQDFYQFSMKIPGRFLIALNDKEEYNHFFEYIDTTKVEGTEFKGCKDSSTFYRISPNCYVCKEGFDYEENRFILRVSRDGNFEFTVDKSVVSKPSKPTPSIEKLRKQKLEKIYQGLNKGNDGSVIRESLPPGAGDGTSTNGDGKTAKTNQPNVNKQKMNEIDKRLEELLKDDNR